jgi:hypothetical protein
MIIVFIYVILLGKYYDYLHENVYTQHVRLETSKKEISWETTLMGK